MRIIDSQIHLFDRESEEHASPIHKIILPPEAIVSAMDAAGVERAYLVPAGGTSGNGVCIGAAQRWPDRFKVMGRITLNKPEGREIVNAWQSSPYIGLRLAFPPFRKVSWLKDGTADWFWPEAQKHDIPVMIWAPEQLNEIGKLAMRYPEVKFIVDHLGLFVDDKGDKITRVVTELLPLAKHPNVAVKASCLPAHSSESYPFRDLHPYIRQVVSAFGSERVMWGTDFTRLPCSYEQAIKMFTEELGFLSGNELENVMANTAFRWIGW